MDDADGRVCSCNTGFTYADDDNGCTGQQIYVQLLAYLAMPSVKALALTAVNATLADTDACETTPCATGDDAAICVDKPAPALGDVRGRACSCETAGFVYDEVNGCMGKLPFFAAA